MANDVNDFRVGDLTYDLLRKILARLKGISGGGGPSEVTATLTVNDMEIGAVEIKDASSDTRAVVKTSDPAGGDAGVVVRNLPSGTQAISAASLPLPTGAATEATLVSIDGKIPASPATDRTVASGPFSVRLSDGAVFIDPRGGDVANDSIDAGNPVKIGGKASDTVPAAVATADRVNGYLDREGRLIVRPWGAGDWTQVHAPVANTRATTTKAAGAAGVRHVCTGITVVLAATATAPTAVNLQVRVRDGVSDAGTVLWEATISLPATAGAMAGITRSGLFIRGTAATAMTLEFSAAGGANTVESVSMEGVDITEA